MTQDQKEDQKAFQIKQRELLMGSKDLSQHVINADINDLEESLEKGNFFFSSIFLSYDLFCQILFDFVLCHSHLISHFTFSLISFTQVSKNKRLYPTLSLYLCPCPTQQKKKRAPHRHSRKLATQEIRVIRKENLAMEDRTKNDERGIKKNYDD